MNGCFNRINTIFKQRSVKQFLGLFSVNLISLPLGFITSIVITRYLGAQGYGDYKFIDSIFRMAIILCNFGLFHAGSRALLLEKERSRSREYYATILVITFILSVIMCIGLFVYALFDPNITSKGLFDVFLLVLPFGIVYMVNHSFETLLQADNQIRLLSIVRLFPKIGYLVGGLVALFYLQDIAFSKLLLVCYIYFITQLIVYIYVLSKLQPSFCNIRSRWGEIKNYNKTYGFDVYVGALFAVGFSTLPDILISYFGLDNQGVGLYSLALMFSSPLLFVPGTIATTQYRKFAEVDKIPSKYIMITVGLSLLAMFSLWAIVPLLTKVFYSEEFSEVITLNFIVSFGVLLYGFADFFNKFIASKGRGKLLRNSSFIVGFTLLLANFALVPSFGAYGASWAKVCSGVVYLLTMLICYFKIIRDK